MDPQQKAIAEEFDGYQNTYEDAVNASLSFSGLKVDFFTHVKADYLMDILSTSLGDPSGLNVLDIGCGVGVYHKLLAPQVGRLTGVDVSSACVEKARSACPGVFYDVYDGARLPYEDGAFDAAFTICVMHHVPTANWERFAAEMFRVVRPGGLGVVFEHNPRNPLTMRVVNNCPFDEDAVLLKSEKTRALLAGAGFAPVKSRHILTIPAAGRLLRTIDGAFSPIGMGAQYYVSGRKPD